MKKFLALVLAVLMVTSSMVFVVSAEEAVTAGAGNTIEDVYSFVVYDESENNYLVRTDAGKNDTQRFSDCNAETVYKFTLVNTDDVQYIKWYIRSWGNMLMQVTTEDASQSSNVNWIEISNTGDEIIDVLDRVYDFTDALVKDGKAPEVFYVRIADSKTDDGWGGSIFTDVVSKLVVGRTPTADEIANTDPDVLAGKTIETQAFEVLADNEKDYLFVDECSGTQNVGTENALRFCDCTNQLIYKYTIQNYKGVDQILWTATVGGELQIQLATTDPTVDGVEWQNVYTLDNKDNRQGASEQTYDLTSLLVTDGVAVKTFYIRLADAFTEDGNGAQILGGGRNTTLRVVSDYATREYTFRVEEKSERKYLMEYGDAQISGTYCRFNDTTAETVYQFSITNTYGVDSITWNAYLGGQLDVSFTTGDASKSSADLEWTSLLNAGTEIKDNALMSFDLTDLLTNEDGSMKTSTFYIRVADSDTSDGNGGRIIMGQDQTLTVRAKEVQPVVNEVEREDSTFTNAVLKYTAELSEGGMFNFAVISHPNYEIQAGDYLVYQVRMDAASRDAHLGSIDMNFDDGSNLRDSGTKDQDDINVHPAEVLANVRDNVWFTRTVSLDNKAGRTITDFMVCMHPEGKAAAGTYSALYDNIIIYSASGVEKCVIYLDETYINMDDFNDDLKNGANGSIENIECPEYEHEYYVFTPLDDGEEGSETPYLVESTAGNNGSCRFSDAGSYTIYKFDIKNTLSVERVIFTAVLGQQMKFSVSMDNKNYTTVYEWRDDAKIADMPSAGWKTAEHTIDLTNGVDFSASSTIYIKIEDTYPENGWGGSIYKDADAMLDVWYVKLSDEELDAYEAKATEHKIPLFGCNSAFGGFTVDKENMLSGSGCATIAVGAGAVNEKKLDVAVDATGMDTLEFDIWVSDAKFFELFAQAGMDSGLEITSAGTCDKQELAWHLADIASNNQGDAIVSGGWAHIILPLSTGAATDTDGAFNIAAVNYFRFFFVKESGDTGVTVKLDNMVFTDYVKQKDEAAAAEAAPVLEKLEALKDAAFTDDNAKSLKSEITKARKAYDKLSDDAKAKVSADVLKYLTDAEKARDEYEASKEATPTPTAEPTAEPTGDVTTAPTAEPTAEPSEGGNTVVIIIIIVAVVVVAAAVCLYFFVFKKKQ